MSNPLVSIIAITRNHENYCVESLNSILNQTYKNLEWIILDAASNDNTPNKIENWLMENNVVAVFLKEKDLQPITINLNKALTFATGQYIQIISLDDVLLEEKIERQVNYFLSNNNLGMVLTDARCIDYEGKILPRIYGPDNKSYQNIANRQWSEILKRNNIICAPTVLIANKLLKELGGFDEELIIEDHDLWYRISLSTWKIEYEKAITVSYRILQNSFWNQSKKNAQIGFFQFYFKHNIDILESNLKSHFRFFSKASLKDRFKVMYWLFKNKKYGIFFKYFYHTILKRIYIFKYSLASFSRVLRL